MQDVDKKQSYKPAYDMALITTTKRRYIIKCTPRKHFRNNQSKYLKPNSLKVFRG